MAFCAKRARDRRSPSSASRQRVSIEAVSASSPKSSAELSGWPLRSMTAFISAPVTAPRSSGSGTVTPVRFRIGLGLAQDDLQHGAVDRAVGREQQCRTDKRGRLAEPIDAPFPLLVPRRVPGQIVVHHGVEQELQIDAFRQAVGGNQQALRNVAVLVRLTHRPHPVAPVVGRQRAGDGFDTNLGK